MLVAISWVLVILVGVLGVRLCRDGYRERSLPLWLVGLFFVGGAPFGYGPLLLRRFVDPATNAWLEILSNTGFMVPLVTLVLFTWKVFRPDAKWARIAALAQCSISFVLYIVSSLAPLLEIQDLTSKDPTKVYFWFAFIVRAVGFGWASTEATLYYIRARRRIAIGLIAPLVANRFFLWAVWCGGSTCILVLRTFEPLVMNEDVVPSWFVISQMLVGITTVGSMYLTFAPPPRYKSWIERSRPQAA